MTQEISAKIEELLKNQDFVMELLQQEDEEAVSALLSREGLDMPKEAVQVLMEEVSKAVNEGLSDEELDTVAGGISEDQVKAGIVNACKWVSDKAAPIAKGVVFVWNKITGIFSKKRKSTSGAVTPKLPTIGG